VCSCAVVAAGNVARLAAAVIIDKFDNVNKHRLLITLPLILDATEKIRPRRLAVC